MKVTVPFFAVAFCLLSNKADASGGTMTETMSAHKFDKEGDFSQYDFTKILPLKPEEIITLVLKCSDLLHSMHADVPVQEIFWQIVFNEANMSELFELEGCKELFANRCGKIVNGTNIWQMLENDTDPNKNRVEQLRDSGCAAKVAAWDKVEVKHVEKLAPLDIRTVGHWATFSPEVLEKLINREDKKVFGNLVSPSGPSLIGLKKILESDSFTSLKNLNWSIVDINVHESVATCSDATIKATVASYFGKVVDNYVQIKTNGEATSVIEFSAFILATRLEFFLEQVLSSSNSNEKANVVDALLRVWNKLSENGSVLVQNFLQNPGADLVNLLRKENKKLSNINELGVRKSLDNIIEECPSSLGGIWESTWFSQYVMMSSNLTDVKQFVGTLEGLFKESVESLKHYVSSHEKFSDVHFPTVALRCCNKLLRAKDNHWCITRIGELLSEKPVLKKDIVNELTKRPGYSRLGYALISTPDELRKVLKIKFKRDHGFNKVLEQPHDDVETESRSARHTADTLMKLIENLDEKSAVKPYEILADHELSIRFINEHRVMNDAGGPLREFIEKMWNAFQHKFQYDPDKYDIVTGTLKEDLSLLKDAQDKSKNADDKSTSAQDKSMDIETSPMSVEEIDESKLAIPGRVKIPELQNLVQSLFEEHKSGGLSPVFYISREMGHLLGGLMAASYNKDAFATFEINKGFLKLFLTSGNEEIKNYFDFSFCSNNDEENKGAFLQLFGVRRFKTLKTLEGFYQSKQFKPNALKFATFYRRFESTAEEEDNDETKYYHLGDLDAKTDVEAAEEAKNIESSYYEVFLNEFTSFIQNARKTFLLVISEKISLEDFMGSDVFYQTFNIDSNINYEYKKTVVDSFTFKGGDAEVPALVPGKVISLKNVVKSFFLSLSSEEFKASIRMVRGGYVTSDIIMEFHHQGIMTPFVGGFDLGLLTEDEIKRAIDGEILRLKRIVQLKIKEGEIEKIVEKEIIEEAPELCRFIRVIYSAAQHTNETLDPNAKSLVNLNAVDPFGGPREENSLFGKFKTYLPFMHTCNTAKLYNFGSAAEAITVLTMSLNQFILHNYMEDLPVERAQQPQNPVPVQPQGAVQVQPQVQPQDAVQEEHMDEN